MTTSFRAALLGAAAGCVALGAQAADLLGSTYYNASVPVYYGAGKQDSGFALVRAGVNYRF